MVRCYYRTDILYYHFSTCRPVFADRMLRGASLAAKMAADAVRPTENTPSLGPAPAVDPLGAPVATTGLVGGAVLAVDGRLGSAPTVIILQVDH